MAVTGTIYAQLCNAANMLLKNLIALKFHTESLHNTEFGEGVKETLETQLTSMVTEQEELLKKVEYCIIQQKRWSELQKVEVQIQELEVTVGTLENCRVALGQAATALRILLEELEVCEKR